MKVALTRAVSPNLNACELTHLDRQLIDVARASAQHARYEAELARLGCEVVHAPAAPELPDSVFIEDTAVVVDEMAIITRPGAESRRGETDAVAEALRKWRDLYPIHAPGTLDGGDVLIVGERVFAGISSRTNLEGARQLAQHLGAYGYDAQFIPIHGALHLKSAVTRVGERRLLLNPEWIDREHFRDFDVIEIDPAEPYAANALLIDDVVLFAEAFPRTRERLEGAGIDVRTIDVSELAKAEGALTCCSIVLSA